MYIKTVGSLLKQAVALKYNFLSLRKFNLLCKTQSSAFDADQEVWVSHNMKCLGTDLKVSLSVISIILMARASGNGKHRNKLR